MIKKKHLIDGAALFCLLSSCSLEQKDQPAPSSQTYINAAGISLVNGRLVFKDYTSFEKLRADLWQKNSSELDQWENQIGISSLRSLRITDEDSLKPNLMREFGFPNQYAALINEKGEYQIGDKIYWFGKGHKFEVSSEDELASVKRDTATAKIKLFAGIQKKNDGTANRTIRYVDLRDNSTTRGDGKYGGSIGEFCLWYDCNSKRRLSFENYIYIEDVTGTSRAYGYYTTVYTAVVFNEYAEYYSRGSKRWYRSNEPRYTSYDLTVTGGVSSECLVKVPNTGPVPAPTGPIRLVQPNTYHDTGTNDYQTGLLYEYSYNQSCPGFNGWWYVDYEVTGTYSAYIASDQDHTHTESGVLW